MWKFFEGDLAHAQRGLSNLDSVDGSSPDVFLCLMGSWFRVEFHHLEIRKKQGNERHLPSKQGLAINSTRSVSSCFVREQLRIPHKVTEESSSASSRHLSLLKIRKQIIVISGKRHAFRTKRKAEKSLLLNKEIRSNINCMVELMDWACKKLGRILGR